MDPHGMPSHCRTADLGIDRDRVEVARAGEILHLPGLTYDTLLCLVERAPAVVSHAELVAAVWQSAAVSDETINQRISLLRRALGDDPASPRYVATVRGRGYRWLPAVLQEAPAAAHHGRRRGRPRRGPVAAAAAVLLVLAASLALSWWREGGAAGGAELPGVRPSAAELTARGRTYLARHRDADNELAVSLFRRALGAADAGPAARVGLSLAYSQRATKFNRAPAWAEDAERLARQALDTRRDAEGYHAFGLALDAQGRVSPALAAYRRAAELDPGHAGAIASAAYLLAVRGELAEALRWDLEALRLDADLPYVEIQIAEVLATLGHATAADVWFRRALALRPDNVFVHGSFARQRLRRGDVAGAEDLAHAAVERGVRRPEPLMILGHAAWMRGRGGEALRHYRRAEALNARQSGAAAYLAALAAGRHRPGNGATPRPPCRPPQQGELDEWPDAAVSSALDCIAAGDRTGALAGLDAAIARGFRDAKWLRLHPAFAPLRGDPGFAARCARIRGLVAAEERRLRNADWLPSGLFGPRPSLTAPCRRRRSPAGGARRGSRRPARASTVR